MAWQKTKRTLVYGGFLAGLLALLLHWTGVAAPVTPPLPGPRPGDAVATLGGGCFWCIESPFEKVHGVTAAISGYMGGHVKDPSYQQVVTGTTGHVEVVQVHFDPAKISYAEILDIFWRQFDPTDAGGQFADRGPQYRPVIFVHDEEQRKIAEASRDALGKSGVFDRPIATAIEKAKVFYPAEDYHQDYFRKNAWRYQAYRQGSGRDRFLKKVWGGKPPPTKKAGGFVKPSPEELRRRLTDLQYRVTQEDATERPFQNEFWDHKEAGIYVDVVSGEPLFSSRHKFKSGTGWPSFVRPLEEGNIVEHEDTTLFMKRVEVRSKGADSHLGHVFTDGPPPTGLRYCINSAALRFVPASELHAQGYGKYAVDFGDAADAPRAGSGSSR